MNLFAKQSLINSILTDVQKVADLLFQKGWSEKNAGNISIKLPDILSSAILNKTDEIPLEVHLPELKNACFYMTGTGKRMQDLANSALGNGLFIQINNSGTAYFAVKQTENEVKPTSELPSHLGVHNMLAERGTKETVVMHTHATEMIVLTQHPQIKSTEALNKILWGMHPEAMMFIPKGVGFVPYVLPGSQAIADATIKNFQKHDIVVWEKHGIFSIGNNLIETFDNIDIACKSAKIWLQCKSAGFEPQGMSEEQLIELKKLFGK